MKKRSRRLGDLEIIEVPEKVVKLAHDRTKDMMRWWATSGSYDLTKLVLSAYLQGVEDGVRAKEHQLEKARSA